LTVLTEGVRHFAVSALAGSPLPALLTPFCAGIGSILTFHQIRHPEYDTPLSSAMTQTPAAFRQILQAIRRLGYEFVSMSEAIARMGTLQSSKFACVTIDDGYDDTFRSAFPICRDLDVPLVVYVATGPMLRKFPMWWLGLERLVSENDRLEYEWEGCRYSYAAKTPVQKRKTYRALATRFANATPSQCLALIAHFEAHYPVSFMELTHQRALTPAMISEMQESGLVEFGAHTVSHVNLRRLDHEEARAEIANSCRDIKAITGCPVRHFAYPYGKADAAGPREFALCQSLRLQTAVTTRMGNLVPGSDAHLHSLPRLSLPGDYDSEALLSVLLSGALPALLAPLRRVMPVS
jgi:peptidoglycan/xylan/chitin deacetylase (PgdA/CDA1 family)